MQEQRILLDLVEELESWDGAKQARFDADHRLVEQYIFAGLENLNPGFDSPSILHCSPIDFRAVIERCVTLGIMPNGIEVFTNRAELLEVEIAPDKGYEWADRLVRQYIAERDVSFCATFEVPDSAYALAGNKLPPSSEVGQ